MMRPNRLHSKKGAMWSALLVIAVIIVVGNILFSASQKFSERKIGEKQFSMIKAVQDGEAARFYISEATRIGLEKSLVDLGLSGGLLKDSSCGSKSGFVLWLNNSQICYPSEELISSTLSTLVPENTRPMLAIYPYASLPTPSISLFYDMTAKYMVLSGASPTPIIINRTSKYHLLSGPGPFAPKPGKKLLPYNTTISYATPLRFSFRSENVLFHYDILVNTTKEFVKLYSEQKFDVALKSISSFNSVYRSSGKLLYLISNTSKSSDWNSKCSISSESPFNISKEGTIFFCFIPASGDYKIRYAIKLPPVAPPPIKELSANPIARSDSLFALSWAESPSKVTAYNLYYSAKNFSLMHLDNMLERGIVKKKSYSVRNLIERNPAYANASCYFTNNRCIYHYGHPSSSLAVGTLYRHNATYVLIINSSTPMFYGVTASNQGAEIDNSKTPMPIVKATAVDNLPPGILNYSINLTSENPPTLIFKYSPPMTNLDGSKRNTSNTLVYSVLWKDCDGSYSVENSQFTTNTELIIPISELPSGKLCFSMYARDSSGNPSFEDSEIPLILKASEKRFVI